MGDFRGYNSAAVAISIEGSTEVDLKLDSTTTTVPTSLLFHLGEVDWFNEEGAYHGRNYFPVTFEEVQVIYEGKILTSIRKGNLRKVGRAYDADFSFNLPIKSGEYSYKATIQIGMGRAGKNEVLFPEISKTFNISKTNDPLYVVQIPASGYANLENSIDSFDSNEHIIDVIAEGGRGKAIYNSGTISIPKVKFRIRTNRSQYYVSSMRWKVYGKLEYQNQNGVIEKSSSWNASKSHNGSLEYNFDLTLPYGDVVKNGYIYRLNITDFDFTDVVTIN